MAYNLEHGLMPQILALIDYPSGSNNDGQSKSKSERHPYYKRPGRGHNRDCCDACGDCGDLLCCDSCPSSFHLICIDPPLEEDDIPNGVWRCHHCKVTKEIELKIAESKTTTCEEILPPKSSISRFFGELSENCRAMNPIEFQLPREYGCYDYPFPGSSKPTAKKKRQTEIETTTVSKSIIICFFCNKTSRTGCLIKCDSCPKCFHLDCLDPPLTFPPTGLWLCPLHPEPFVEQKLLKSTRLSERVRLWDRSREPVDQASITLNFFKKVNQENPMFSRKVSVVQPPRPAVKIPAAIAQCYNEFREGSDSDYGFTAVPYESDFDCYNYESDSQRMSEDENKPQENQVSKSLSVLADVADIFSGVLRGKSDTETQAQAADKSPNSLKCLAAKRLFESREKQEIKIPEETLLEAPIIPKTSSDSIEDMEVDPPVEANDPEILKIEENTTEREILKTETTNQPEISISLKQETEVKDAEISVQPEQANSSEVQKVESSEHAEPKVENTDMEISSEVKDELTEQVKQEKIDLDAETDTKPIKAEIPEDPKKSEREIESMPTLNRAIYYPAPFLSLLCINSGTKITFKMKSIIVGRGAEATLDLSKYTDCRRISPNHATIFYDSIYLRWELLNYGPTGTLVNNCLYGCDLSHTKVNSAGPGTGGTVVDTSTMTVREKTMRDFQEVIQKRKEVLTSWRRNERGYKSTGNNFWELPCRCIPKVPVTKKIGWEGSATLGKGVRIQIGCAKFIVLKAQCEEILLNSDSDL